MWKNQFIWKFISIHLFLQIILILNVTAEENKSLNYLIVAPRILYPTRPYTVGVSINNTSGRDIILNITVHDTNDRINQSRFILFTAANQSQPLQNTNAQIVDFRFDTLPSSIKKYTYELLVEASGGWNFRNSTTIKVETSGESSEAQLYSYHLQTDRNVYQPGDVIRYQLIVLNGDLRPPPSKAFNKHPLQLLLEDASGNRIQFLPRIHLYNGVFSGEYLLAKEPIMGKWSLRIWLEQEIMVERRILIQQQKVPRFLVSLSKTPRDFTLHDPSIRIHVQTEYFYGKRVRGNVSVALINQYRKGRKIMRSAFIDGETEVSFPFDQELFKLLPFVKQPNDNQTESVEQEQEQEHGQEQGEGHEEESPKDINIYEDEPFYSSFNEDLQFYDQQPLQVLATVTESLTGREQNASIQILVHRHPYVIQVPDTIRTFEVNKTFPVDIQVNYLNGSFVNGSPDALALFYTREENNVSQVFYANLNEKGVAHFMVNLNGEYPRYDPFVRFQEIVTYLPAIYRQKNLTESKTREKDDKLLLTLSKKRFCLGENLILQVQHPASIQQLSYVLMSRGNILIMDTPKALSSTSSIINVTVSFSMMPVVRFFVSGFKAGHLIYSQIEVELEKDFENQLNITGPLNVKKPGENVTLDIQTDPGSLVALMAIDERIADIDQYQLEREQILQQLSRFIRPSQMRGGIGPGKNLGLIIMTNAHYTNPVLREAIYSSYPIDGEDEDGLPITLEDDDDNDNQIRKKDTNFKNTLTLSKPRQYFPKVWIWQQFNVSSNGKGRISLIKSIPDSMTNWLVMGFAINRKTGFTSIRNPFRIRVFQKFFVDMSLPFAMKRYEILTLPIHIYNYLERNVNVGIEMCHLRGDYEFLSTIPSLTMTGKDSPSNNRTEIIGNCSRTQLFMNGESEVGSILLRIRPLKIGLIRFKLKAFIIDEQMEDIIHRTLNVDAEGLRVFRSKTYYLHSPNTSSTLLRPLYEFRTNISEDTLVKDSEYFEFRIMGNIVTSTLNQLNRLIRKPDGCGEQNLIKLIPNILVLDYIRSNRQDSQSWGKKSTTNSLKNLEKIALEHLNVGYQRQLSFREKDGGYGFFKEQISSTWLTSYVMRAFTLAHNFTTIDPNVIEECLEYLIKQQDTNGAFQETSKQGPAKDMPSLALNSYVLLALTQYWENIDDNGMKIYQTLSKALHHVLKGLENTTNDTYAMSVTLRSLSYLTTVRGNITCEEEECEKAFKDIESVKSSKLHSLIERKLQQLELVALQKDDLRWWSMEEQGKEIEITANLLMTYLHLGKALDTILPIVRWLLQQREANGGFNSPLDTNIALESLFLFVERYPSAQNVRNTLITLTPFDGKGRLSGRQQNATLSNENYSNLQSFQLPSNTRRVQVQVTGNHSALLQLSYHYNVKDNGRQSSSGSAFVLNISVIHGNNPTLLINPIKDNTSISMHEFHNYLNICTENRQNFETNMMLMEIYLPSGFIIDRETFEQLSSAVERIQRLELEDNSSKGRIYLDYLHSNEELCIPIYLEKIFDINDGKTAPIIVYDYYNTTDTYTVEYYQI